MADLQTLVSATRKGAVLDIGSDEFTLDKPLYVRDKHIVGDGAIIVAAPGQVGVRCRGDVQLLGNVRVIGDKPPTYGYVGPPEEFLHGIVTEGVTSLKCSWTVQDVWGDGFYIGRGPDRVATSRNVELFGMKVLRPGRQGISVVHAEGVDIHDVWIEGQARSVLDIEPPGTQWICRRITFRDSVAIRGHNYLLANKAKGQAICEDITIENIWGVERSVDCRVVTLERRRKRYRFAGLKSNARPEAHHETLRLWGIDGVEIEESTCNVRRFPNFGLHRTNDCTDVRIT